jgi:hypothetical protein
MVGGQGEHGGTLAFVGVAITDELELAGVGGVRLPLSGVTDTWVPAVGCAWAGTSSGRACWAALVDWVGPVTGFGFHFTFPFILFTDFYVVLQKFYLPFYRSI